MPVIRRSFTVKPNMQKARITKVLGSPIRRMGPPLVRGSATKRRRSFQPLSAVKTPRTVRTPKTPSVSHVKVAVRVRPLNERERGMEGSGLHTVVKAYNNHVLFDPDVEDENPFFHNGRRQFLPSAARKKHQNITYTYDTVFQETSNNKEVFEKTMTEVVDVVLEGYNASVFAYGATGAGKTHTMIGNSSDPGITYLTAAELFTRTHDRPSGSVEFKVSYLEVYNEHVYDLLEPGKEALQVMEDGTFVTVKGLSWRSPKNPEELLDMLASGNQYRAQSATAMNNDSSRSHAVFTIQITQKVFTEMEIENGDMAEVPQAKYSKLVLVDLAGSERASATSATGTRFKEGKNINQSLLALGRCINDLVEGKSHITFRGSKLTRILKDCLGGNCRTVMLAAISPTSLQFSDTKNTLEYASRARKITCNLKQNVRSVQSTGQCLKIVADLSLENNQLRLKNDELETELRKVKEQLETATANQQARAEERNLRQFGDLLKSLDTAFRRQRAWDADLHEIWMQKSNSHFRLERARVMESQLEFLRKLTDAFEKAQPMDRVKSQMEQQMARLEANERELVNKMEANAEAIWEAIEAVKKRADELGYGRDGEMPLAVQLAYGLQAKMEARSARATEDCYKYLLNEAEREFAYYQKVLSIALPLTKRSCLLAQQRGRDTVIDGYLNELQEVVGRRGGIHFDDELREPETNTEVASMPSQMLVMFGQNSSAVRNFIPPLPYSPAGCSPSPPAGEETASEASEVSNVQEGLHLKPATKEKWVKMPVLEEQSGTESESESPPDDPPSFRGTPLADRSSNNGEPNLRATGAGDWSNLVSSTPFVSSSFASSAAGRARMTPVTPLTPGSSIVNYSDSDDESTPKAATVVVERTFVKNDSDSENRNPLGACPAIVNGPAIKEVDALPAKNRSYSPGVSRREFGKPRAPMFAPRGILKNNYYPSRPQGSQNQFGPQPPFRPRYSGPSGVGAAGGGPGAGNGTHRSYPSFGMPFQPAPHGRVPAPSGGPSSAGPNANRLGAVRYNAPVPAHLRHGVQ